MQSAAEQTAILSALPWKTSAPTNSNNNEDQATTVRMLGSIGHISSCPPHAFVECNGVDVGTAQRISAVFKT
jgi:hypothetical protein